MVRRARDRNCGYRDRCGVVNCALSEVSSRIHIRQHQAYTSNSRSVSTAVGGELLLQGLETYSPLVLCAQFSFDLHYSSLKSKPRFTKSPAANRNGTGVASHCVSFQRKNANYVDSANTSFIPFLDKALFLLNVLEFLGKVLLIILLKVKALIP